MGRLCRTVNIAGKIHAAQRALVRRINAGRRVSEQMTLKMLRALLTLQDRYHETRRRLRHKSDYKPLTCVCKLDRLVLTAWKLSWQTFKDLGYSGFITQRLWDQNYRFVKRLKGRGSVRYINIEYEPNASWLAPFRITIIPRDGPGVAVRDLQSIVELIPQLKLVLMEVAFDFPIDSIIDVDLIRRYLLSGKMWLPLGMYLDSLHQRWGPPTGSRAIRVYVKWETTVTRLELQLNARFLRDKKIEDIFDFQRLPTILAGKHLRFAQLDEKELVKRLRRNGFGGSRQQEILSEVRKRNASLWEVLKYLRRTVHLTNVRRLVLPVEELDQVVAKALTDWATGWPKKPTRLGGNK